MLAIHTLAHLCVDFACFYLLFSSFAVSGQGQLTALAFIVYNTLAFGLQPLFGALGDRFGRIPMAAIGCAAALVGLALTGFPWPAMVLMALGNALFHVGAGRDVLVISNGRMARSGIFVSSGALGVALGTWAGRSLLSLWLPIVMLAASLALTAFIARRAHSAATPNMNPMPRRAFLLPPRRVWWAVIVLCAGSIIIRSYAGSVVSMPWRTTAVLALLPGAASCLGKCGGGFLADRVGPRRLGVGSLLLSMPLLTLGSGEPILCLLGILLFNMSMPVTLCTVFAALPHSPGLSFGITTLALLCGNLPTFFVPPIPPPVLAALVLVSALCLVWGTTDRRPKKEDIDHVVMDSHAA